MGANEKRVLPTAGKWSFASLLLGIAGFAVLWAYIPYKAEAIFEDIVKACIIAGLSFLIHWSFSIGARPHDFESINNPERADHARRDRVLIFIGLCALFGFGLQP